MNKPTNSWKRVQEIFFEAIEKDEAARLPYIQNACGDDATLFTEVVTLIDAYSTVPGDLDASPINMEANEISIPADAVPGYELLEEIRRGGQGIVFRANQIATKRTVAIKFMLTGALVSPLMRQRFQREIELASRLRHPGIVPIFDGGMAQGHPFYVMEYVKGEQLDEYVLRRDLSVDQIVLLITRLCDAVAAAHKQRIVHRDIKPSNILVTEDREIHVLDFGLARALSGDTLETLSLTGQIMGTLQYMSPEQACGQQDSVGPPSDVYSICLIAYGLLASEPAYRLEGTFQENLATIIASNPSPLSTRIKSISPLLSTIILKGLSKSPEDRYVDASELADKLRGYLGGASIRYSRIHQFVSKSWKTALAFTMPVALFAAFVGWAFWAGTQPSQRPSNDPLAALSPGEFYTQFQLQSQIDALHEITREGIEGKQLLDSFQIRFDAISVDDFEGLSKESSADLGLLLSVRDYLKSTPLRADVLQRMEAARESPPSSFHLAGGRTREIQIALLKAWLLRNGS
ncbi:MAG: serine/threonine-protein kinase [Planctomycetota bacterium]